jgi:hypothetical protein
VPQFKCEKLKEFVAFMQVSTKRDSQVVVLASRQAKASALAFETRESRGLQPLGYA